MSSLAFAEKKRLESFFGMGGGYVLGFSDREFGAFVLEAVGVNIHDAKYTSGGTSKANKLRGFWQLEDDATVARLLRALIDYAELTEDDDVMARAIATRLMATRSGLKPLKQQAERLSAANLKDQIRRMEDSVDVDPALAIGTAKELIETCCKTILKARGVEFAPGDDLPTLNKKTLKALRLLASDVPERARGEDVIKRLLSNLATVANGLAELRGLYGTGHGKEAGAKGVSARHARLAVGSAATLAMFLFETHEATK